MHDKNLNIEHSFEHFTNFKQYAIASYYSAIIHCNMFDINEQGPINRGDLRNADAAKSLNNIF